MTMNSRDKCQNNICKVIIAENMEKFRILSENQSPITTILFNFNDGKNFFFEILQFLKKKDFLSKISSGILK